MPATTIATATLPEEHAIPDAPPETAFWKRYNDRLEMPTSIVGSVCAHAAIVFAAKCAVKKRGGLVGPFFRKLLRGPEANIGVRRRELQLGQNRQRLPPHAIVQFHLVRRLRGGWRGRDCS